MPHEHPCIICQSATGYYFSKDYPTYPLSPFKETLKVDYNKCSHCGFVFSVTHQEMTKDDWSQLNTSWHHHFEKNVESQTSNQPPYADQALALNILAKNGVVDLGNTLDYAAGYGTLARALRKYFSVEINIFDRFVRSEGAGNASPFYLDDIHGKKYKLVINSAMFEHVLKREDLDAVNDLVADDGILMLHTVICERVPADPNWFYLDPMVHTAFHTNKSMEILMSQWGYSASVYSPQSKSWFLFKKDAPALNKLESVVTRTNNELQTKYFYYKNGFMDFWKGF